ncbi:MAG: SUMF1/EgtB/PvdO family nonheme iron enzyme [bacterium]
MLQHGFLNKRGDSFGNKQSQIQNPLGFRPQGSNRVIRGGSWNNNANNCRVANRNNNWPDNRNNNIGFRAVRPPAHRACLTAAR